MNGLAASSSRDDALAALAVLGSGGEKLHALNVANSIAQERYTDGFWMSYHELTSDYPWLRKRLAHVEAADGAGRGYRPPRRNFFAGVLAAITQRFGIGGGASLVMTIALIEILAAGAIPAYQDYEVRMQVSQALPLVGQIEAVAGEYIETNDTYPESLGAIGLPEERDEGPLRRIELIKDGIELTLRGAHHLVDGQTLILSAYRRDDGSIAWECSAGTLDPKYLPPRCRAR
ncbi:MAG: pilin [Gammaproteobacteria bacterium]|nr:pilin [Gammaproteobacteria bacterium]